MELFHCYGQLRGTKSFYTAMSRKKKNVDNSDIKQVVDTNNGIIDAMKKLSMALCQSKVDDKAVPNTKPL
jgi:hypothetical protein